MTEKLLKL